ncbi:MAG: hypothetical protein IAE97_07065 [Chthoniobacterales bacterium]|nr:hypothetical protein [Chthoniobacterales bacterium]
MKSGFTYHWVAEESRGEQNGQKVSFANNPMVSPNTQLIASALISGFKLVEPGGFRDTVEQTDRGPVRRVEWFIDGGSRATFRTAAGSEDIEFPEFRRRYESEDWCLANPDHPIAFMRWAFRAHGQLRDRIRTLKPAALIRRGNRHITVPDGLPADKRLQLLKFLGS